MPNEEWRRPRDDDLAAWVRELRKRTHEIGNELAKRDLRILRLEQQIREKDNELAQIIAHTVIVIAILCVYVVVLVTGNDATAILGILIGYIGGSGVQKVVASRDEKVKTG